MGVVLAWMMWTGCLRGWRASVISVGGVGGVLTWLVYYNHFYCYYSNTILKKNMLNVYF